MENIFLGDTIDLNFEVKYPSPLKSVELKIENENMSFPWECNIKDNIVSSLIKGEVPGNYTAWFRCLFLDSSIRAFPLEYQVKDREVIKSKAIPVVANVEVKNNTAVNRKQEPFLEKSLYSQEAAKAIGDKLNIDWKKINLEEFTMGLGVESSEHGKSNPETNVTNNNDEMAAKIVLAHLNELLDYYTKLKKIEKGFDPESENLYDILDANLSKMAHPLAPAGQKLPLGTKALSERIELSLYSGLRDVVNSWFGEVKKDSDPEYVLANLKFDLMKWRQAKRLELRKDLQELFVKGLEAGARQTGITTEMPIMKVNTAIIGDIGGLEAADRFSDTVFDIAKKVIKQHYDMEKGLGLYRTKRDLDSQLHDQRYKTRQILRSETAKLSNWGLLKSWEADDNKYNYNYFWNAILDKSTKNISKIRKEMNPLTIDECKYLWENQEQLLEKGWESDSHNQRCSISREPRSDKYEGNRFAGREHEFRRTLPE